MQLFISYAHVDKYHMEISILPTLKEGGHTPWYDHELLPGQIWENKLRKSISECEVFLYILTPESINSYWCRWEFNTAADFQKRFIPILLRSNAVIPHPISRFQCSDFTNGPTMISVEKLHKGLASNDSEIYFLSSDDKLELIQNLGTLQSSPPKISSHLTLSSVSVKDKWVDIAQSDNKRIQVVAGPGTGKTFSMIRRVIRLLEEGCDPRRLLLITFSRTGARDLEQAFEKQSVPHSASIRKGTLHSFCSNLLRESRIWKQSGREVRTLLDFERRFMMEDLSNKTGEGIKVLEERLQAFETVWARKPDQEAGYARDDADRNFYLALDTWLKFHKALLIEEIIPQTLTYLRDNPASPELRHYEHILVDEYQDLNRADQTLLDELSKNASLTVIGDEDQAIYERLRYSHPEGIYNFTKTHQGAERYSLELCRRCPTKIVDMANHFNQPNKNREGRKLVPQVKNGLGEVHIVQWQNLDSEAEGLAKYIKTRVERGEMFPQDILILCTRRDFGSRIKDVLSSPQYEVPVKLLFRPKIFKANPAQNEIDETDIKPELKAQERFTLLKLLANPEDRVSLRCWLGFGSLHRRSVSYLKLWDVCTQTDLFSSGERSPRQVLDEIIAGNLNVSATEQIVERYRLLLHYQEQFQNKDGLYIFDNLFPSNETWSSYFRDSVANSGSELTLDGILEVIDRSVQEPVLFAESDSVRILTLHQSKGLEASHVIVVGCIQGLIPSNPSEDDLRVMNRKRYEEEQRRLFYVAITRAKKSLVLSSTINLPLSFAKQKGAEIISYYNKEFVKVRASDFTSKAELGSECPTPVFGDDWRY